MRLLANLLKGREVPGHEVAMRFGARSARHARGWGWKCNEYTYIQLVPSKGSSGLDIMVPLISLCCLRFCLLSYMKKKHSRQIFTVLDLVTEGKPCGKNLNNQSAGSICACFYGEGNPEEIREKPEGEKPSNNNNTAPITPLNTYPSTLAQQDTWLKYQQ